MALSFKYTFTYEEVNPSFFYLGLFLQVSFGGKGECGGEGVYIIKLESWSSAVQFVSLLVQRNSLF